MKKLFTLMAGMVLAVGSAQAGQYNDLPKSSLSVSYGWAPLTELLDGIGSAIVLPIAVAVDENAKLDGKGSWGVINVDYTYNVTNGIALGMNLNYSSGDGTVISTSSSDKSGKEKETNFTLMPTVRFDWFRREKISLYSRLSAGVTFQTRTCSRDGQENKENSTAGNFQISPIGLEVGSSTFRGFVEAGLGQCGVLQVGLRTRF